LLAKIESGAVEYYHPDQLSVRLMTDSSGNVIGQQAHYPFGEQWYAQNTTTKWFFTRYERDAESGNDYATFRYNVNRLGRFSQPDLLAGSIGDPQSLNRYAYVRGDPVNLVDPLGLDCNWTDPDEPCNGGSGVGDSGYDPGVAYALEPAPGSGPGYGCGPGLDSPGGLTRTCNPGICNPNAECGDFGGSPGGNGPYYSSQCNVTYSPPVGEGQGGVTVSCVDTIALGSSPNGPTGTGGVVVAICPLCKLPLNSRKVPAVLLLPVPSTQQCDQVIGCAAPGTPSNSYDPFAAPTSSSPWVCAVNNVVGSAIGGAIVGGLTAGPGGAATVGLEGAAAGLLTNVYTGCAPASP
jgi:RHS repeat-associated protein